MYTFPQQQKIFKELLNNNPSNKQCADCGTVGPTWASLNFGVFLCSNCSGAHRALGPTITRVKSTKLDQWQKEWMECMYVGNKEVNEYWESDLGMAKKPKMGASQQELIKYAGEKYVKKRYVKNASEEDPLTRYKNGTYVKSGPKEEAKPVQTRPAVKTHSEVPKIQKPAQVRSNIAVQNEGKNFNLIQFQFPESPKLQVKSQTQQINRNNNAHLVMPTLSPPTQVVRQSSQNHSHHQPADDDDDFTEFTEHGTSFTNTTADRALTYEELIAKKSTDSADMRYNIPMSLHHTQSASNIPHYNSPHFNINMNGNTHHVGGPHAPVNGHYGGNVNMRPIYNQPAQQSPYQSVGYLPTNNSHQQQQYGSMYHGQNGHYVNGQSSMGQMGQNYGINQQNSTHLVGHVNQQNNNFASLNLMSNQQNLNPSNMSLGGYHNQGYGSHAAQQSTQKPEEFKWNDFSGWQGIHQGGMHQNTAPQQNQNQNQQQQNQQQGKSWLDEWK